MFGDEYAYILADSIEPALKTRPENREIDVKVDIQKRYKLLKPGIHH